MARHARILALGFTFAMTLLASVSASAQPDNAFAGVDGVKIIVETPSDDAGRCNVTKGSLDASVRLPIDKSRLRIAERNRAFASVYVNVNVIPLSADFCVANVKVSLQRLVLLPSVIGKKAADAGDMMFSATVWSQASLLSGRSVDFGSRVNVSVTELANELIAGWIEANPK